MSSLTISTIVCVDCQPCSSIVGLNTRTRACPGSRLRAKFQCDKRGAVEVGGLRAPAGPRDRPGRSSGRQSPRSSRAGALRSSRGRARRLPADARSPPGFLSASISILRRARKDGYASPDADVDPVGAVGVGARRRPAHRRSWCGASRWRASRTGARACRARTASRRGPAPRSSIRAGRRRGRRAGAGSPPSGRTSIRSAHHEPPAIANAAAEHVPRPAETVIELGEHGVAPAGERFAARERQQRAPLDAVRRPGDAQRVDDRRHDVDPLDEARAPPCRGSRRRAGPGRATINGTRTISS